VPPSTTTRLLNSLLHGNESRETPVVRVVAEIISAANLKGTVGTVVVSGTNHQSGAFASGITPAADCYSAVPRMAWDGIHLASPTATNGQSLLGRTVVAHSLATNPIGMGATPPTDWDNELLTANASSSTVVPSESGCDDWRDSDSDQLPDWYETHIAALSARDGLNSANDITPSLVLWGSLWQGTPVTVLQVLQFGGDPGLPMNAQGDFDSDGLNDFFERLAGTDPRKYDTDDDGMGDGWELRHGLDPKSAAGSNGAAADLDNDGLSNLDESRHGTDPDEADTDGDSAPPPFGSGGNRNDGQEVGRGLDPLKRNDPDEPDMRRKVRFRVGDPSDSDSERYIFRIRGTGPDGRQLVWMNTTTDVEQFEWILHRGSSYIIDLLHRKTRLATPDYDYQVQIRSDTTTGWITGTNWRGAPAGEPEVHVVSLNTLPDNTTGSVAAWVADNREHVLGRHWEGSFHNQEFEINSRKAVLIPVEVVEVSPKTKDENGNDIVGSEKPSTGKPLTPFVELNPVADKIAHRELKVKLGDVLKTKRVTWTLEPVPGATPATIRGAWTHSTTHPNRFETSATYGANGFISLSQASATTTISNDGFTAIRVNVPPIGFNQVRIKIQVEGTTTPIDLIDMEVPGVVVIDPGHGGQDSGAVGRTDTSVLEKDLALAYSLSLRQNVIDKFAAEKHGLKLVMTRRTTGEYMENAARAHLSRDRGADLFLSIHFNSADATTARGTEYVTRSTGQVNAAEDDSLGVSVQGSTLAAVRASDAGAMHREPKSGQFAVISDASYGNTAAYHPIRGVIIEVEFLSHETALESVKLSNATGTAIKTKFAADVSTDIYNNILNQP
jgi:N-acetylmuramoyl-L-alanine amidase